jgi:hypothetical protein
MRRPATPAAPTAAAAAATDPQLAQAQLKRGGFIFDVQDTSWIWAGNG